MGLSPCEEPAHRHGHRDLRRLGHRGHGGDRRCRRGGRHGRDRHGDAVRHPRARAAAAAPRCPSASPTSSSGCGPGPASTRSVRWLPRPARRGRPCVATAVVVKLTRVVMLAPVVAAVSVVQRMRSSAPSSEGGRTPDRAALRARLPGMRRPAQHGSHARDSPGLDQPRSRSPPSAPPCSAWAAASRSRRSPRGAAPSWSPRPSGRSSSAASPWPGSSWSPVAEDRGRSTWTRLCGRPRRPWPTSRTGRRSPSGGFGVCGIPVGPHRGVARTRGRRPRGRVEQLRRRRLGPGAAARRRDASAGWSPRTSARTRSSPGSTSGVSSRSS